MANRIKQSISGFLNFDKKTHIVLFIITLAVAFRSSFNPLIFRRMHIDSSVYITVAQAITRGFLPYVDIVDNKGPLTYLFSVPGLYLGGFTGIWITEIIFLWVSVIFAYKIALLFAEPFIALLGTIFSFVAILPFFLVNAGTEQYALPFLMISFYIFTKHLFSPERKVKFTELIVLGICFASAIMLKLNLFPLWAGFCLIIFVESMLKLRSAGKILLKYLVGFCLGITIVFIPLFLYLRLNGIFEAFVEQVILGGMDRGFSTSNIQDIQRFFFTVLDRNNSFIPLLLGAFWMIKNLKQQSFSFYFAYTFSYFLAILFHSFSRGGPHHNLVLAPFFVPAVTFFSNVFYTSFSKIKFKLVFLSLLFCLAFSDGIIRYMYYVTLPIFDNSGQQLIEAGRLIDENTKPGDEIISLGDNAYIYPFTQRNAASRFYYQGGQLLFIPNAREEFISDILTKRPAIIAIMAGHDGLFPYQEDWHAQIYEMKEKYYSILHEVPNIRLYTRDE